MDLLWPVSLLFLAVLPILVVAYVRSLRRGRRSGVRYSSLTLVRAALPGSSRLRRHLPFACFMLALGALIVAFARPVAILSVPTSGTTIILTMDVSGSMCSGDIQPSRLLAAEQAAESFVRRQGSTTQIGIVAFSGFAEVVQAPTNDQHLLLSALQSLVTGRRTAIGSGILASIDAIAEADPGVPPSSTDTRPGGPVTPVLPGVYAPDIVVLLTDGANNTGPQPVDAAQQATDRGVRVYTIGFGTAQGGAFDPGCAAQFLGREPGAGNGFGVGGGQGGGAGGFRRGIDEATLQQVADLTGGTYYPAESADQLQQVFDHLPTTLITKHEAVELSVGFVALGAILVALSFLLGRAWRPLP
jgi:Ca-activated chloride channel family protein